MGNKIKIINNEDGSAIVLALIILALVTIIGISSSTTSTIELKIVRNERVHQINFYQAEASAYEAAQRIEQEINTDQLIPDMTGYNWLNDDNTIDFSVPSNWQDFGLASGNANDNSDLSLYDPNAFYSTVAKGVRSGSSLDIGSTRLYDFAAFGLSQSSNGEAVIEIGYLKRF